jgi:hypothetical protein
MKMSLEYETTVPLYTAAGADTNGAVVPCAGLGTVCVQLSGTLTTVVVYWEGTVDGSNWIGVLGWNRNTGVKALSTTAVGLYVVDVTALTAFRARLAWTTGSVTAVAKGSAIPTTTLVTAS